MTIDLGPTFISLAGGAVPSQMDGKSIESLWADPQGSRGFRDNVLIEYSGEEKRSIRGCPQWEDQRLFVSARWGGVEGGSVCVCVCVGGVSVTVCLRGGEEEHPGLSPVGRPTALRECTLDSNFISFYL